MSVKKFPARVRYSTGLNTDIRIKDCYLLASLDELKESWVEINGDLHHQDVTPLSHHSILSWLEFEEKDLQRLNIFINPAYPYDEQTTNKYENERKQLMENINMLKSFIPKQD